MEKEKTKKSRTKEYINRRETKKEEEFRLDKEYDRSYHGAQEKEEKSINNNFLYCGFTVDRRREDEEHADID